MFTNTEAEWFQAFRRAVLESEPDFAYRCAEDALTLISKRLCNPDLDESERQFFNSELPSVRRIECYAGSRILARGLMKGLQTP
jgi:hypothetical protein